MICRAGSPVMVLVSVMVVLALGRPIPSKLKLPIGESVTPSGAMDLSATPLVGWLIATGAAQSVFEMALISLAETHTTMGRRHAMAVFCAKRTTAWASS